MPLLINGTIKDDIANGVALGLSNAVLRIYSGPVPANADAAIGNAVLLCEIADPDGDYAAVEVTASGLSKPSTVAWKGDVVEGGVPSFYRLSPIDDDGSSSYTGMRVQGTAGPTGDLLVRPILSVDSELTVDSFDIYFPF